MIREIPSLALARAQTAPRRFHRCRRSTFPVVALSPLWLATLWLATLAGLLPLPLHAQEEAEPTDGSLSAEVDSQSDQVVESGLRRRYQEIEGLENLEVDVNASVVTLGGEVLGESERAQALELARRIEGVASVQDEIDVVVDPRKRLKPAVEDAVGRIRDLISYIPLLGISLLVIFFFVLLSRWLGRWDRIYSWVSDNRFAQDLLRQATRVAVILVGVLIALEILDATALVGAVLGTAGVVGLAVGFAFRDLVENYISSVLLSIRQPFSPNDHVSIDGKDGKVMRLTSRATILMTLDGNHLRIPNSQVFKGVVLNYTRNPRRRFDFGVGVGVGEDLSRARELGVEALLGMEGVIAEPPPMAVIEELGDSNVLIRFYGWVDQREADFSKVKGEAIRIVKTVLEDADMDLPEPIYRVHMVDAGKTEPPTKGKAKPGTPVDQPQADIGPDNHLERQIAEDRAQDEGGQDLLDESGPSE